MREGMLRIGELASRVGVSADSIRHYERMGLLPPLQRTAAGYRVFPPGAVARVELIRAAVRVGFSLRQLAGFLRERQAGGAPCRQVRDAAERVLADVDDRLAELTAARAALARMVRDWDERLARTPANTPAYLLDHMEPVASRPRQTRALRRPVAQRTGTA